MSFFKSVRFIVSTIIAGALVLIPYTANFLIGQAQSILASAGVPEWPTTSYKLTVFILIWLILYAILFLATPKSDT